MGDYYEMLSEKGIGSRFKERLHDCFLFKLAFREDSEIPSSHSAESLTRKKLTDAVTKGHTLGDQAQAEEKYR